MFRAYTKSPAMTGGGGGGGDAIPNRLFKFFSLMGRAFLQTKFLAVGLSLGHLSIEKIFQIGPTVLALKLDKGRVLATIHQWAKVDLFF